MGKYGTCCAEMDIWEANRVSSAFTAHPCNVDVQTRCEDADSCGDTTRTSGHCDKDGCDLNAYRANVHNFFGQGSSFNVDTTKPVTVVTQFVTADGTDNGELVEIKRLFVQNGKVIEHPSDQLGGAKAYNSLSDEMCAAHKETFGDDNDFKTKGGMA
jgi:cellulose 1,4-beta-cellobiosidase